MEARRAVFNLAVRWRFVGGAGLVVAVVGIVAASFWAEPASTPAVENASPGAGELALAPATSPVSPRPSAPAFVAEHASADALDAGFGPAVDSGGASSAARERRGSPDGGAATPSAQPPPLEPEQPPPQREPISHRGPEPVGDDPCVVPIYFDWFERRQHLSPADHARMTVRLTVEGYTTPWWLNPDKPGNSFLWAIEDDIPAKRVEGDRKSGTFVTLKSVRLGAREITDVRLPLALSNHPTGGVFGSLLSNAFGVVVDYGRGVLVFEDCR